MKKEKLKEMYYNKGYNAAVKEVDLQNEMRRLREEVYRFEAPSELIYRLEQMEKRMIEIEKKLEGM